MTRDDDAARHARRPRTSPLRLIVETVTVVAAVGVVTAGSIAAVASWATR